VSESTQKVDTYEVEYLCDDCGVPVDSTGMIFTVCPAIYEHKCSKCNRIYNFGISYPYIKREYSNKEIGKDLN